MLLLSLLFLQFLVLHFSNLLVRFPPFLTMQHHVPLIIDTIRDFRKWVVTAVVAELNFFVLNSKFFPTQIALINESTNAANFPAIQRQKLYTHLNCHVLDGKISTNYPNTESFLSLGHLLLGRRCYLCHLPLIVLCSNPSLLSLWLARWRRYFAFRLHRNNCPLLLLLALFNFILL